MPYTSSIFTLVTLSLLSRISLASPIDITSELVARDNNYHLNCSNAPGIVAGNPVAQSDVVISATLPESGSTQQWFKYLWCTPGTSTYIFFDFGQADPYPAGYFNAYQAVNQAHAAAQDNLAAMGDDYIEGKDNANNVKVNFGAAYANTGFSVYMQDQKGHLKWAAVEAALRGLSNAVLNFNKGNYPMVFQVGDGSSGTVGNGYLGIDAAGCAYEITPDGVKDCVDVRLDKVGL